MIAAEGYHFATVISLLRRRARVDLQNKVSAKIIVNLFLFLVTLLSGWQDGYSALIKASEIGFVVVVDALVAHNAQVDLRTNVCTHRSVFFGAIVRNFSHELSMINIFPWTNIVSTAIQR